MFHSNTEVYSSDGLVCIEEVQVGDSAWAYNSETGETELKEVLNVWIKETDEILHVETADGETIDTTTNHPFYVEEKGWVAAGDLEVGDVLYTADGDEVEVTDIELEKLAEPIIVYNLDVADFDTYFVGEYGVLVHNSYAVNEGDIGSYSSLIGKPHDDLTPHHMPSNMYMLQCGVDTKDALCLVVDAPTKGGGRHRMTFTYGRRMSDPKLIEYMKLSPRDALAFDLKDIINLSFNNAYECIRKAYLMRSNNDKITYEYAQMLIINQQYDKSRKILMKILRRNNTYKSAKDLLSKIT